MKSYVIAWHSKSAPATLGKGKKLFTQEEALRLAEELNAEYPGFHHEAFDTGSEDPVPATPTATDP